jgi:hypothetical protein
MSLADQKTAFILANGDPVTIIRTSGNLSTIARIMPMKREKTRGFLSYNYMKDALFTANSGLKRGDLIRDESTGDQYYVLGFQPKELQGVVTSIKAELFRINSDSNVAVSVTRIIQNATPTYDSFGKPTNSTTSTFTVNAIIHEKSTELTPSVVGGKRKEILKIIAATGMFQVADEISFNSHVYKVEGFDSDDLYVYNILDYVHATREVD